MWKKTRFKYVSSLVVRFDFQTDSFHISRDMSTHWILFFFSCMAFMVSHLRSHNLFLCLSLRQYRAAKYLIRSIYLTRTHASLSFPFNFFQFKTIRTLITFLITPSTYFTHTHTNNQTFIYIVKHTLSRLREVARKSKTTICDRCDILCTQPHNSHE